MKQWAKIGLFISSYSPLFVLLAIQEQDNKVLGLLLGQPALSALCILLALLGVLFTLGFLMVSKTVAPVPLKVAQIVRNNQDTISYLLTYLVPFVGLKFDTIRGLVVNTLLMMLIGFLYIQSNMIYLNPLLSAMGFRVIRIHTPDGSEKIVIAKKQPKVDTSIKVVILGAGLYVRRDD